MRRGEDSVPTGATWGLRAADGAGETACHRSISRLAGQRSTGRGLRVPVDYWFALNADIWAALNFRQPLIMLQAIGGSEPNKLDGVRTLRPDSGHAGRRPDQSGQAGRKPAPASNHACGALCGSLRGNASLFLLTVAVRCA